MCTTSIWAQQRAQYSLKIYDKYKITNAYGGMDGSLVINGTTRSQWVELPNRPSQQRLTAHMPVYLLKGAVGLQFESDNIGFEDRLSFSGSYNYVFENAYGLFSFGMSLGLMQHTIDGDALRTPDGEYEGLNIIHNDPTLFTGSMSGISPAGRLGFYFTNGVIEAGLSIENLFASTVAIADGLSLETQRQFQGFVEYQYRYDESFIITPFVFLKTDITQMQSQVGGHINYRDLYFGGLSLRGYSGNTFDALSIFAGTNLNKNLKIAYAFDLTLSNLRTVEDGTHELMLLYNLKKPIGVGKPQPIIYNPRF